MTNPADSQRQSPASPSSVHTIFLGLDGLRAGWSLLLFLLLVWLLGYSADAGLHLLYQAPHHTSGTPIAPLPNFLRDLSAFLALAVAARIMAAIERRPFRAYGLGLTPRALPQFAAGVAWGLLFLAALAGLLTASHLLVLSGTELHVASALRYGFVWACVFLTVGLAEEFAFRGYLQFTLARGLAGALRALNGSPFASAAGFWTSALVLSFVFGLGHRSNPGESPLGLLSAGLIGLVFCLSLWRTGSLWWAVGFHAAWDWAQSFLFGVADSGTLIQHHLLASYPQGRPLLSGGTTGPEGSLYVLGIIPAIAVTLFLTLHPSSPPITDNDSHKT